MRKHRVILVLTAVGLAVALGVSVTAAVQLYCYRLPHPEHADRGELLRWLVVSDLSQESRDLQRTLVSRLEEEFSEEIDWEATAEKLNQPQRERLWQNVLVLLEPWFADKVDGYFKLPPAERTSYVDRLLDTVAVWSQVESLRQYTADQAAGAPETPRTSTKTSAGGGSSCQTGTKSGGTSAGLLKTLAEKTEQWKRQADPQRRKEINQFVLAVQFRWLARKLSSAPPLFR